MASVNKVIVLGNVGKDPEVRYTNNGSAVATLSIATTRRYKDGAGEKKEETEWHRVVLFSRLAEIAGEYVRKGNPLFVEGRLTTRKWTDKEGVERYTTEIVGESIQLLGSRDRGDSEDQPAPASKPKGKPVSESVPSDFDDDIPF